MLACWRLGKDEQSDRVLERVKIRNDRVNVYFERIVLPREMDQSPLLTCQLCLLFYSCPPWRTSTTTERAGTENPIVSLLVGSIKWNQLGVLNLGTANRSVLTFQLSEIHV